MKSASIVTVLATVAAFSLHAQDIKIFPSPSGGMDGDRYIVVDLEYPQVVAKMSKDSSHHLSFTVITYLEDIPEEMSIEEAEALFESPAWEFEKEHIIKEDILFQEGNFWDFQNKVLPVTFSFAPDSLSGASILSGKILRTEGQQKLVLAEGNVVPHYVFFFIAVMVVIIAFRLLPRSVSNM